MQSAWLRATLICGTLDILYAIVLTILRDGDVVQMLSGVASGPLGDAAQNWGFAGAAAGLAVHFAIMGGMAAAGLFLFRSTPLGNGNPWLAGTLYGLALYCVMYGVVLPLRFGAPFPNPDKLKLALGLFPHIFFVGIPMAFLLRRPSV